MSKTFILNINKLIKEAEAKKDYGECKDCIFFCFKNNRDMCSKYTMYTEKHKTCKGFIRSKKNA